jgi:hypothetical protein
MSWPRRGSSIELALAAGAVLFVIGLAVMVSVDLTDTFDASVIGLVRAPELVGVLAPLRSITELGSTAAVAAVAIVSALLGPLIGTWRSGLGGAMAITLASLGNSAFKIGIARERPSLLEPVIVEHGFSFPSGHSALGMVAYGVLAVVVSRSSLPRAARVRSWSRLARSWDSSACRASGSGFTTRPMCWPAGRPARSWCWCTPRSPAPGRLCQAWHRLPRIQQRHDPIHLRQGQALLAADERTQGARKSAASVTASTR